MGFNRQRPESLSSDLKRISIEFCANSQEREQRAIADYVNSVIFGTETFNVNIDDWRLLSSVERSTRRHQRVKFNNCFIQAITIKANNNKVVKIKAELIDLSVGGACIAIPDTLKVIGKKKAKEGEFIDEPANIKIKFDFIEDVILKGIIRRVKAPKMSPAADLDNFDFENVLPQYWKVNG